MADDAPKSMADLDLAAMAKLEDTKETLDAAAELRAARLAENERMNAEYEFPDTYNPKMGLKQGRVTELRMFYTVKPGHAEELKKELHVFSEKEARNSKLVHLMTGIRTMTGTLFDNDTRYCHTAEFDTEWDPYIEDALPTDYNREMYYLWMRHLEEFPDRFTPENLPTANDIKVIFNQQRVTATVYIRTFGQSNLEVYRMMDLKKAFDEVLDHPDAAEALSHPALAKLLDLAAD
jgi:hypothetical protein